MAKFKSTIDNLLFDDMTIDLDGDGFPKAVKLNKNEYLPIDDIDEDQFRHSYHSGSLRRCINKGWIVEESEPEVSEEEIKADVVAIIKDLVLQHMNSINALQFLPVNGVGVDNAIAGSADADITVEIGVCDGQGTVILFDNTRTVKVTITGGTAATKQIRTIGGVYGAGPITLTATRGKIQFQVKGSVGTITLGLSDSNPVINSIDTATITLI